MFVVVLSFFRSPRGLVDVLVHGAALQPHRDAMLRVGRPIIQGEGLEEQIDGDSLRFFSQRAQTTMGNGFSRDHLVLDRCIDRVMFLDSGFQHPLLCRAKCFVGTPSYQSGCHQTFTLEQSTSVLEGLVHNGGCEVNMVGCSRELVAVSSERAGIQFQIRAREMRTVGDEEPSPSGVKVFVGPAEVNDVIYFLVHEGIWDKLRARHLVVSLELEAEVLTAIRLAPGSGLDGGNSKDKVRVKTRQVWEVPPAPWHRTLTEWPTESSTSEDDSTSD